MSLEKLKVIGNDSPHLSKLNLNGTFWSITTETVDDWQVEFVDVLDGHFSKLTFIDAGGLPYPEGLFGNELEIAMRSRRILFKWVGCSGMCLRYQLPSPSYGSRAPPRGYGSDDEYH